MPPTHTLKHVYCIGLECQADCYTIDEETTLEDVREHCPAMFEQSDEDETFYVYRGFLVHCHVEEMWLGGESNVASVWFFDSEKKTLHYALKRHASSATAFEMSNKEQANRLVDLIIETGMCSKRLRRRVLKASAACVPDTANT